MKFQLSEILPGIPTWFIARQHRFTIDTRRTTRHPLAHRRPVPRPRAKSTSPSSAPSATKLPTPIISTSPYADSVPHNFFDILQEGLELTLRRYPWPQGHSPPYPVLTPPEPPTAHHEFDYANLTKRLERTPPKNTIECPNCLERYLRHPSFSSVFTTPPRMRL